MQAGYVSMAVVVRKNDDVAAPRMYRCMVGGGYRVFAAIIGPN